MDLGNRVVVVGGGVVGSSIAYHLSKMGAEVTLIEKDEPGAHASGKSFSWINASYPKKPWSYFHLSRLSLASYLNLQNQLNLDIKWGGSFEWFGTEELTQMLEKEIKNIQLYDYRKPINEYPVMMIDQDQARNLEPNVNFGSHSSIAFSKIDGAIDSLSAIREFLRKTKEFGGQVLFPATFQKFKYLGKKLVAIQTSVGEIATDQVIFACGVDTDSNLNSNVMKSSRPGIILTSKPMEKIVDGVIVAPGVHIHQQIDGKVIIGEQQGAPVSHFDRLTHRPEKFPNEEDSSQHQDRILNIATKFIPKLSNFDMEKITIGWRPLPKDEKPVVGPLLKMPGVYVAAMHSGITLAPIVGNLCQTELLDGNPSSLLEDFRPSRFN
ncbi:MAG: FAD-dependent oxidoreductase [Candidatus Marinimicrobia bacterium]|jgi:glycine/D-amino acid oxidase-like deaminating enzyme|nr:FAD-dependent oxidoreductase [Candidatus Neomarinimicrobiota bacterium]